MDGTREPHFEAAFLEHAERMAGMNREWAEEVKVRLHRMAREKGPDSYLTLSLSQITRELGEEALDLGGMVVGRSPRLLRLRPRPREGPRLPDAQRAAAYGPLVDDLVQRALDLSGLPTRRAVRLALD